MNTNFYAITDFSIQRTATKKLEKLTALLHPFNAPDIQVLTLQQVIIACVRSFVFGTSKMILPYYV